MEERRPGNQPENEHRVLQTKVKTLSFILSEMGNHWYVLNRSGSFCLWHGGRTLLKSRGRSRDQLGSNCENPDKR